MKHLTKPHNAIRILTTATCMASILLTACAYQEDRNASRENPLAIDELKVNEPGLKNDGVAEHESRQQDIGKSVIQHKNQGQSPQVMPAQYPLGLAGPSIKERKASKAEILASHLPRTGVPMPQKRLSADSFVDAHGPFYYREQGRERYAELVHNSVKLAAEEPVSTFSIDVDTGAYANVRRLLNQGQLPPVDAVRIEEMINYFDYQYQGPESSEQPFSIHTEIARSPWSAQHALLRVGLQGYQPPTNERPAANLVFLLDVSGSMNSPDKLPLLKQSLTLLVKQLGERDRVAIVVYAGASGVVLEPTAGNDMHAIESALAALQAGGSTNGQAGIQLAYQMAQQAFIEQGINRVILATDGDFNVGTRDVDALKQLIAQKRAQGISLTTLGFGSGNYNDHLMEQLADVGNGNYAYIDTLKEARKSLVEQINGTLMTIAKDVKIQIEFNPERVKEYRLLGYENRMMAKEDFNNDKVDAGEIGAGHNVTAIYEILLHGEGKGLVDPLRYSKRADVPMSQQDNNSKELAFIKFRYKQPCNTISDNANKSLLLSRPIVMPNQIREFAQASEGFRFAAAVGYFGELLRKSKYISHSDYEQIVQLALAARGNDPLGYRSEFVQLVRLASSLAASQINKG